MGEMYSKRTIVFAVVLSLVLGLISGCQFGPSDGSWDRGIFSFAWLMYDWVTSDAVEEELPDPEKYANYCLYDYNLYCLDAENGTSSVLYNGGPFRAHYRKVVGESDEQFVSATMTQMMGSRNWALVFQNPEDYVDVWAEWTIKEMQVYYYYRNFSIHEPNDEEEEPCRTPHGILLSSTDAVIAEELKTFATDENYTFSRYSSQDTFEKVVYDGNNPLMVIRVYFNESETIVWDAVVNCYADVATNERYFSIYRSTYEHAEGNVLDLNSMASEVAVLNLPALEAFLMEAVDTYWDSVKNGETTP